MHPIVRQFRDRAATNVDPAFWAYVTRGMDAGVSVGEAQSAWQHYRFSPRVLRDVSTVDTRASIFGDFASPIGVAPTAFHRLAHTDGEVATATGASAAGVPLCLSSRSTCRIETVAAAVNGPWWLQVYVTKERAVTEAMVRRSVAAGATALVLTADTPYVGHRDIVGSGRPMQLDDDLALVNMGEHLSPQQLADPWAHVDQDPSIDLDTIGWLHGISGLPVIVKGVLRPDDANRFVDAGAAGIWVSNHGGRQLDRAVSTADVLPAVVAEVGDAVPVVVDGGVRDGYDVLTALALGASAVFVGRPAVWALAADGAQGVETVMTALTDELGHLMGLAGVTDLGQVRSAGLIAH